MALYQCPVCSTLYTRGGKCRNECCPDHSKPPVLKPTEEKHIEDGRECPVCGVVFLVGGNGACSNTQCNFADLVKYAYADGARI
jgi:hypothetical protein